MIQRKAAITTDYYLTTVLENSKKPVEVLRRNCSTGFSNLPEICAELLKALQLQGFLFVCQKTPTFLTVPAEIRRKALQTGTLAERQRKKRRGLTTV